MKNNKIMIIDLLNMFIRSFSALPTLNQNGEHVGGVFGTLQSIIGSIEKFSPNTVFCMWEGKNSGERRRKLLLDYKAGRRFTGFNRIFETNGQDERASFLDQLKTIKEILDALPIHQFNVDKLEADDVIAYICTNLLKEEEKIIISTDRDYFQLLDKQTIIFRPVKTKIDKLGQIVCLKEVEEEGKNKKEIFVSSFENKSFIESIPCAPKNYPLMKCVCGDDSDNIKGIGGYGEKTFLKKFPFVCFYKDEDNIYTVEDLVDYAKNNHSDKNNYDKFLIDENIELMKNNYNIVQLLSPKMISAAAKKAIISNIDGCPKLDTFSLIHLLKQQNVSMKKILEWQSIFSNFNRNSGEII